MQLPACAGSALGIIPATEASIRQAFQLGTSTPKSRAALHRRFEVCCFHQSTGL